MKQSWYHKNQGNGQGLIIDEDTGRNVAVAYDSKDAALLASAPDLLAACQHVLGILESPAPNKPGGVSRTKLREAIAKATRS